MTCSEIGVYQRACELYDYYMYLGGDFQEETLIPRGIESGLVRVQLDMYFSHT